MSTADAAAATRALVTGAAGGLGREVAVQLAARGCAVGIADINAAGLAETARLVRGRRRRGRGASPATSPARARPRRRSPAVVDRWGGIDALVNNAGYGVIEPFLDSTHQAWTRTLALNVTALAMACKAAGRVMRDQRSGRIVNITSPGSRMALPDYTAYTASKAGVDSITRAAAVALAPYGVLVNSLAPGMMDTEMQRSTEADLARVKGRDDLQAFLDERTARVPLGRRAEIAEIAAVGRLARPRRARLHDRRPAQRLRRPRQGLTACAATPRPTPPTSPRSRRRATRLRRHMLEMARGQGQGYIGQGLGIADLLAALYFHELRYDPADLAWPERDRFLLSTGHYSIALWAALAEAGILPVEELATYGADDSRLEMSTLDTTPGRRDDRRLARPRPRPGGRPGPRPAPLRLGGARLRRALRRRDAGGLDLGGGHVRQPLPPRRPGGADRLQRHPGRRRRSCSTWSRSPTSGAPSAGTPPRSTATTWPRSSPR